MPKIHKLPVVKQVLGVVGTLIKLSDEDRYAGREEFDHDRHPEDESK